jgi:hypothetical protein
MAYTAKARDAMKKLLFPAGVVLLFISLFGCGGTKVLKEPEPLVVTQPLATALDQRLQVTLGWVIVRDGPGTWAKNADWDEYLINVRNVSGDSLQVSKITIVDSLDTRVESGATRRQLVKGTKEAKRRYKGEGLTVKAGAGTSTLMVGGVAAAAGAAGVVALAGGPLAMGGGAAVAATGLVLAAPVLVVGGVFRGVNNSKVNKQIEYRQTPLPVVLQKEEEKSLDIFFPLAPSARQVEITYADSQGGHTLIVDTHVALEGLHLVQATE